MKLKEIVKRARRVSEPYRVAKGKRFRIKDWDAFQSSERKHLETVEKDSQGSLIHASRDRH